MNPLPEDEEEDPILKNTFLDFRFGKYKKEESKQLYKNLYSLSMFESSKSFRHIGANYRSLMKQENTLQPTKVNAERSCSSYLIVSLNSPWKTALDSFMALFVAYSCFSSIYFLAFGTPDNDAILAVHILIEVIFFFYLVLHFFEEYTDILTNKTIRNFSMIAKNYLYSWFIIDFLAVLPLHLINSDFYAIKLLRLVHLPSFLAFFDLTRILAFLNRFSDKVSRSKQIETQYLLKCVYKIVRLLLISLLITYFLGLGMYIISDRMNPSDTM